MPKTNTNPPLPITWSLTGKRGRKATTTTHATSSSSASSSEDYDTAKYLLLLSSSSSHEDFCHPLPTHQCQICGKSFKSHQGLGGHISSHFKFKKPVKEAEEMEDGQSKEHRCSICHRSFASGQALGGHKRCHWVKREDGEQVGKKKKQKQLSSILCFGFDLNQLPPKEEEQEDVYRECQVSVAPLMPYVVHS